MNYSKRILVDKSGIIFWMFFLIFFLGVNIGISFIDVDTTNILMLVIIITLRIISLVIFMLISLFFNRSCNYVYYQNGILERRGFFFGFKKKIEVKNIIRVEKIFLHLDGEYFLLFDGKSNVLERIKKNSAIFVPFNDEGLDFIKCFWEGEISK